MNGLFGDGVGFLLQERLGLEEVPVCLYDDSMVDVGRRFM